MNKDQPWAEKYRPRNFDDIVLDENNRILFMLNKILNLPTNTLKLIKVLKGEFLICLVKVDNWDQPSKNLEILKYKLNDEFNC